MSASKHKHKTLIQKSLLEIKHLRAQLEQQQNKDREPIAIIGMSCRFPGGADSPEAYWKLLIDGIDAISEVPEDRWSIEDYYDDNPMTPGKILTQYGGFLNGLKEFDAEFFGISPREANTLDPQQRLLLEVTWEALERANVVPRTKASRNTGVFLGISSNDYSQLILERDETEIDAYLATGNSHSTAAGRISYLLGFTAPCIAVDTACSSSLVAVHLACKSLRNYECDAVVSGGVHRLIAPKFSINFSQAKMLSSDGRCKTFDASANGFVRGEGCGMIVLKRLTDAVKNGDRILAVIRGSAVNQDGNSSSLTVPSGVSQQSVISQALADGGIEAKDISYVEAHGTGTSLGDPIEITALGEVFKRKSDHPLLVGSVKTNIGHLEAAAGIASLIKVVLSLQHKQIPPHLHFNQPNPYIEWDRVGINVVSQGKKLILNKPHLAGVSSFGFSGTNAHLVIEDGNTFTKDYTKNKKDYDDLRDLHLLALSGKSESALKDLAKLYQEHLFASGSSASLKDICYTSVVGRTHFDYRLVVLSKNIEDLNNNLSAFNKDEETKGVYTRITKLKNNETKTAFLFSGQGTQYVLMAQQLYQTQPSFRHTIEQCDQILQSHLKQPLISVIYPKNQNTNFINQTEYTQPALFAIEYALAKLWQDWGIQPDLVIGHSLGEYVAATIAGVFSLEDALMLVAQRAKLMQELPPQGVMLAVFAEASAVAEIIEPYLSQVNIAAVNSSDNIVLSGHVEAMKSVTTELEAQGIELRPLNVSHAFHSPLMQPMLTEFERVAHRVNYSSPKLKITSNVTGNIIGDEIASAEYWCHHITQTVQFKTGIETLDREKINILIEIGPKPVLLGMARSILSSTEKPRLYLPSLSPRQSDWQQILHSLSQLYLHGASIDWIAFNKDYPCRRVSLPTYPFQRQSYWFEETKNPQLKAVQSFSKGSHSSYIQLLEQGELDLLSQQLYEESDFSLDELEFLPKFFKTITKQSLKHTSKAFNNEHFYQIKWQQNSLQSNSTFKNSELGNSGIWLIFADQQGFGELMGNSLRDKGQDCFLIYEGDIYQENNSRSFNINSSSLKDFGCIYQKIHEVNISLKGVIHFWSLDFPSTDNLTFDSLEKAQTSAFNQVINLAKTLNKNQKLNSSRIWLITNNIFDINSSQTLNISQSLVWGLGKVIALEYPLLWGGLIDIDFGCSQQDNISNLLREIHNGNSDKNQIAFRKGARYVARLAHCSQQKHKQMRFYSDATYLIFGHLGDLEVSIAQWMVKRGAKHLILTTKTSPSLETATKLSKLENKGIKITIITTDVYSVSDTKKLIEQICDSKFILKGIINSSSLYKYQEINELDLESFKSVLLSKIAPAWILHQLTEKIELDFFVCFSSAASVLGSKGQAHNAAADCFLDAMINYRHSLGLRALSINWGSWNNGDSSIKKFQVLSNRMGLKALSSKEEMESLEFLIDSNLVQATVANINWKQFKNVYTHMGLGSFLEQIEVPSSETIYYKTNQQSTIMLRLEETAVENRQSVLIDCLQTEVARILKIEPPQLVDPERGFFNIGMDSLMAIELKNNLEIAFDSPLPATIAFETPTIVHLAEYLSKEILKWDSPEYQTDTQNETNASLADIAKLTEDKVQESIAKKLEKLENLTREN